MSFMCQEVRLAATPQTAVNAMAVVDLQGVPLRVGRVGVARVLILASLLIIQTTDAIVATLRVWKLGLQEAQGLPGPLLNLLAFRLWVQRRLRLLSNRNRNLNSHPSTSVLCLPQPRQQQSVVPALLATRTCTLHIPQRRNNSSP